MVVDLISPGEGGGYFGHCDFLIKQYICHRMRPISPLRSVTLTCNIKITYGTPKMLKYILVPMLSTLRNSNVVLVFMLEYGHSIAR